MIGCDRSYYPTIERCGFSRFSPLLPFLTIGFLKSEVRRRRSLERALEEAEATNRSNLADASEVDSAALAAARAAADASTRTVVELRGQLARAMEGSVDLETRLKESDEENRRLKREVAEAVELGVRCVFVPYFLHSQEQVVVT